MRVWEPEYTMMMNTKIFAVPTCFKEFSYKLIIYYHNMKTFQPITVHHKLPESFWGNLRPNNTVQLKQNIHRALHTIFQDDTPIQRIRRSLEVDKTVLQPDVYLAISDTLKRFEGLIEVDTYEIDCINRDKFIKRLTK